MWRSLFAWKPHASDARSSADLNPHREFTWRFITQNCIHRFEWTAIRMEVLLFYSLLASVISLLIVAIRAIRALLNLPHHAPNLLTPGRGLLNEAIFLFGVLFTSAIFARSERRSFADYGLPFRGAFGARFLGVIWGVTLMSCVLLVLRATGNFYFGSLGLTLAKIPAFAVLWAAFFGMLGVAEGFAFSGYPLFTLTRGVGFWPAAALLAVLFGGLHLAINGGENWLGSVSLVIVDGCCCL